MEKAPLSAAVAHLAANAPKSGIIMAMIHRDWRRRKALFLRSTLIRSISAATSRINILGLKPRISSSVRYLGALHRYRRRQTSFPFNPSNNSKPRASGIYHFFSFTNTAKYHLDCFFISHALSIFNINYP